MTTFDKREADFEAMFAHDSELQFRATARRNRLLGLWAAELLGYDAEKAEAYAKEVVLSDLEKAGDGDVLEKLHADFAKAGIAMESSVIRAEMNRLLNVAREQILSE